MDQHDPSVSELLPLMRAASTSPEGPKWSREGSADSDGEWGLSQSVRKSQRPRNCTPIDSGSESDFRPVVKEEIKIEVTSPRVERPSSPSVSDDDPFSDRALHSLVKEEKYRPRSPSPSEDFIGFTEVDRDSACFINNAKRSLLLGCSSAIRDSTEVFAEGVFIKSQRLVINYRDVDGLVDSNIFCDVCCRDWDGECPVHGPLKIIHDTKARPGIGDVDRDVKTLPPSLSSGQSTNPASGTGVLAEKDIPARQRLGPYEGTLTTEESQARGRTTGYRWQIKKGDRVHHSVNAEDPSCSNWLRRVNCARSEEEQNLVAFQYRGQIYFRTSKPVPRGSELLVYYGDDSARELTVHSETSEKSVTSSPAGPSSSDPSVSELLPLMRAASTSPEGPKWSRKGSADSDGEWGPSQSVRKSQRLRDSTPIDSGSESDFRPVVKEEIKIEVTSPRVERPSSPSVSDDDPFSDRALHSLVKEEKYRPRSPSPSEDFIGFTEVDRDSACFISSVKRDMLLGCPSDSEDSAEVFAEGEFIKSQRLVINYRDVDGLDDSNIFCDVCCRDCDGECPVHGPLKIIHDTKARPGIGDADRDVKTLPPSLSSGQSTNPASGTGVLAEKDLPARQRLGPYEGILTTEQSQARTTGYRWQIKKGDRVHHSVNAEDPSCSNWLRRVNCARSEEEQNLVAFQYRGQIYFRTSKPVPRGSELLVYYGDDSARELTVHSETSGESVTSSPAGPSSSGIGFTLRCPHCDFRCLGHYLDGHVKTSHGHIGRNGRFKCEWCQYSTDKSTRMERHRRIHTGERPYGCSICKARFSERSNLITHMRTHTGEQPYGCSICMARFARRGNLIKHMRTHTGERPHGCSICKARFSERSNLITHLRTHTGERPFCCSICMARFARRGNLIKHMRTHTGERPYGCSICTARFTQRSSLNNHMRSHTGERPYSCSRCQARFAERGHLKAHMRTHTGERPHGCSICTARFTQRSSLNNHMRSHTGERPYSCSRCQARFAERGNLIKHMRTHTGERPYDCSHCQARFTQRAHLTKHMRTHAKCNRTAATSV
ncbi:histone-lysine N-methyltransferase PRDM9-like isoform X7 [Amphibalanus amphitrite]|uniref:histone-lysine N-methyltransferase PRDM9-like isoform X7 n=1 Tax=Amphibalanus amphitrite TaxID=1232801 RepID=UPI001C91E103|nr:histone-lysine N-methyltransferase PRDM9-like isoform X7 [Amphibalanus amphitrite]